MYLDAVRYRFMPEATTRIAALQTGEVQLASTIPSRTAPAHRERKDLAIREVFPVGGTYIIVNSQYGLTANVLIRQAIGAAINVGEISEGAGGVNKRNPWMSFPGTPYYLGETAPTPWYDIKDPAKAKELLKQAGYKNEKIIIETNSNYQWMRTTMLVVAEQLKAAGMNGRGQGRRLDDQRIAHAAGHGRMEPVDHAFGPDHILGPQQWRPHDLRLPAHPGNEALDNAYEEFFSEPTSSAAGRWLKIQQQVLGGAYMIKIADSGRLSGYSRKLKGQSDYAGILQLWDLYLE